jgi:hypothetical protein
LTCANPFGESFNHEKVGLSMVALTKKKAGIAAGLSVEGFGFSVRS